MAKTLEGLLRVSTSVTSGDYSAVGISDLDTARSHRRRAGRNTNANTDRGSSVDGSSGGAACYARIAHGSERTSDDGVRLRYERAGARRQDPIASEETSNAGHGGQGKAQKLYSCMGH